MTTTEKTMPLHERYNHDYFIIQQAKSDAKVRWEYERLLTMGNLHLRPTFAVLDAACGAAPGLRYFTGRVSSVVGLDVADAALRAARRMLPDARLISGDLDDPLPFRNQSFDLIVLREAIEHVMSGTRTLRECYRILRPGGCVALTTPNRWDARRPLFAATHRIWSGDADPTHTHIFDPPDMRTCFHNAGFSDVRIRTGFKPMLRAGGRRLPFEITVPFPPLVGNGIVAFGWRGDSQ